ncbi:MAG: hypothetical protein HZB51_06070 [Chloroflexi bacterium]|nr:hypothetical protein [Chloroflexota bacterium]
MQKLPSLELGYCYHIYNRGINHEEIFFEERNYRYFLELYAKYIEPIADTYTYCLLKNHFHLLNRIKTEEEQRETFQVSSAPKEPHNLEGPGSQIFKLLNPTQQFSNFFNAYAKAINKAYNRTGGLFQERFGRVLVTLDEYFATLVTYIHRYPQKHGFVDDYREYPYSSFAAFCSNKPTRIKRDLVLDWFNGKDWFMQVHQESVNESKIKRLIVDDD